MKRLLVLLIFWWIIIGCGNTLPTEPKEDSIYRQFYVDSSDTNIKRKDAVD